MEDTARSALVEMRRLFGVLRGEPDSDPDLSPQPGLDQLPALVELVRAAGVAADVTVTGLPRALTPGLDLAAYRVLQEALTNVLAHAAAHSVEVTTAWHPDRLALGVRDDGRGRPPTRGSGHGLVGMRERAPLYGGSVVAEPCEGGGWSVDVVRPLTAPALSARP